MKLSTKSPLLKENINKSILKAVKESAIDCTLFNKAGGKDNLQCFTFGGS